MYKCKYCDFETDNRGKIARHTQSCLNLKSGSTRAAEKRMALYAQNPKLCLTCGKPITYLQLRCAKNKEVLYCSRSCSSKGNKNGVKYTETRFCKQCKKEIGSGYGARKKKFCSKKCRVDHKFAIVLNKFKEGSLIYRWRIYECLVHLNGNVCSICKAPGEWNGKFLRLIVDHIDGNASNNLPENLRLVCPNCNSQLPTFCSRNLGNGRGSRGLTLN